MNQSATPDNSATANSKDIVLYDLAFRHRDSLARIVAHELSHVIYEELSGEDRASFRQAAGWIEHESKKGAYKAADDKVFIESDSRHSISEDFANHIEHYLFRE